MVEGPLPAAQISMQHSLKLFGESRIHAVKKEMKQLHDRKCMVARNVGVLIRNYDTIVTTEQRKTTANEIVRSQHKRYSRIVWTQYPRYGTYVGLSQTCRERNDKC